MGLRKKLSAEAFEKLEDALKSVYAKGEDDNYHLTLDDDDSAKLRDELKKFRQTNIDVMKERDGLAAKMKEFDGLDVEAAKKALAEQQKIKDKQLLDEGKVEELLLQRTERMRSDFEGRIKRMDEELSSTISARDKYRKQLNKEVIDSRLSKAISAVGTVRQGAMEDLLSRGRGTWKLNDDGVPVPYDAQGNVRYGKDPQKVMSEEEWASEVAQTAPWFFEDTKGAGGTGSQQTRHSNIGEKMIDGSDKKAFGANIENIASGKVKATLSGTR